MRLFSCPENCGIIEHMMKNEDRKSSLSLPLFFKSILWSSNFKNIDPEKAKRTIIIQAINYGDLRHWRWILARYGNEGLIKCSVRFPVPRYGFGHCASLPSYSALKHFSMHLEALEIG